MRERVHVLGRGAGVVTVWFSPAAWLRGSEAPGPGRASGTGPLSSAGFAGGAPASAVFLSFQGLVHRARLQIQAHLGGGRSRRGGRGRRLQGGLQAALGGPQRPDAAGQRRGALGPVHQEVGPGFESRSLLVSTAPSE